MTSKGLLARAIGVVFSPRATYADVAARPRVLGALVTVILISAVATFAFLSTEVGRNALVDAQLSRMESIGRQPSDADIERMERFAPFSGYFSIAAIVVGIPVATLVISAVAVAIFTAALGGNATFKQIYAVVAHSWFLPALQSVFVLPLNYVRESLSSSTSLAIFFPMLDDTSYLARLLGIIDLFRIWWIVSLAIGLGVLCKRRTSPIAWALLGLYGIIAVVVAAVMTALSGA